MARKRAQPIKPVFVDVEPKTAIDRMPPETPPMPEKDEAPRLSVALGKPGPKGQLVLVRLDERNWMLVRERLREKGKSAGEVAQVLVGYYARLRTAVADAVEILAGDEEAVRDLRSLIAAVEAATAQVDKALEKFLEPQIIVVSP